MRISDDLAPRVRPLAAHGPRPCAGLGARFPFSRSALPVGWGRCLFVAVGPVARRCAEVVKNTTSGLPRMACRETRARPAANTPFFGGFGNALSVNMLHMCAAHGIHVQPFSDCQTPPFGGPKVGFGSAKGRVWQRVGCPSVPQKVPYRTACRAFRPAKRCPEPCRCACTAPGRRGEEVLKKASSFFTDSAV